MSVTHNSNEDIIGRADINDIEAILSVSNTDVDEVEHIVKDNADAIFTWDYSLARPQLRKLYEKAKTGQWNASTDLDWDTEVDLEKVVTADRAAEQSGFTADHYAGTAVEKWGDKEWLEFGIDQRRWTLSQFLHGEQGAFCLNTVTGTEPAHCNTTRTKFLRHRQRGEHMTSSTTCHHHHLITSPLCHVSPASPPPGHCPSPD
jgi:hypothetical protein